MELQLIPIANTTLAFIPVFAVMSRRGVVAGTAVYANVRMLVQLVAVGIARWSRRVRVGFDTGSVTQQA